MPDWTDDTGVETIVRVTEPKDLAALNELKRQADAKRNLELARRAEILEPGPVAAVEPPPPLDSFDGAAVIVDVPPPRPEQPVVVARSGGRWLLVAAIRMALAAAAGAVGYYLA